MNALKFQKPQRAFLKWAGGKRQLLDKILPHLSAKDCLIEPFVGAGSIFLNANYKHYVLFDINADLINLFKIIQHHCEDFIHHSKNYFSLECNCPEFYYAQRQKFNSLQDEFEKAILFLYLNRFGYNGLCRYNLKQEFNVPFGHFKKIYFPENEIRFFAQKAQRATFICGDFAQAFELADRKNVIYCDPPYAPLNIRKNNFTSYAGNKFDQKEQQRLASLAELSQEQKIPVLISNHDTKFTRQIYSQASKIISFQAKRYIASSPNHRIPVRELLAIF